MTPAAVIEFLLILLIAASIIAVIASRFRIPYTVALVLGGFGMNFFHVPIEKVLNHGQGNADHFLTPDVVFILFLPALLFEAGINLHLGQLRENVSTILLLAIAGVLIAVLTTGYAVHWFIGLQLMPALIFGALISATDPVSVLALFKELSVPKRLSVLIEGESLFNDGTAVVLFQILVAAAASSGRINILDGIRQFVIVAVGGAVLGIGLGYLFSRLTEQIDDPRIEITLTTILAYGAYLIAEYIHVSGVIATVAAGLMLGNFGAEIGMSARTRVAVWSYWEYISFVINSLVFLLIGIEVHVLDLFTAWRAILLALLMVLGGRAVAVYGLLPVTRFAGHSVPLRWQHLIVWGGIHGGLSIALALSLESSLPGRNMILTMTFGVVAFSIIVQGLSLKPAIRFLNIDAKREHEYDCARVGSIALNAARRELDSLDRGNVISQQVYTRLQHELEERAAGARNQLAKLDTLHPEWAEEEMRVARLRMISAEKGAIQRSANEGLISPAGAERMLEQADERLDELNE